MTMTIAITGVGAVCPAGEGEAPFRRAIATGPDLAMTWPKRPVPGLPVDRVVAIPEAFWQKHGAPDRDRAAILADVTVGAALRDAGLSDGLVSRLGCVLATTTGGVEAVEDGIAGIRRPPGMDEADASILLASPGIAWGGPTAMLSSACSSGLSAPALAAAMLADGEADAMVAGGLDVLLEYTLLGFNSLRLVSDDRCRPFGAGRRGVVLSEGAAAVCLEPLERALARGARIRAVISGFGLGCDAGHVTAPAVEGLVRAMAGALEDAGIGPSDIVGILAHGTGTPTNDINEVEALKRLFAEVLLPPVTSIKAVLGHPQAAAGAFSLLAAVAALDGDGLPPVAGQDWSIDPALGGLDVVTATSRPLPRPDGRRRRHLLVDAFGFGGNNCVMVVSDPPTGTTGAVEMER
ncbi:MAG: beta-ketoacyl synthase [Telmatospirillum sp.]|nr:beta-ketoacyl synthase [Telmatospirillum sp.]